MWKVGREVYPVNANVLPLLVVRVSESGMALVLKFLPSTASRRGRMLLVRPFWAARR